VALEGSGRRARPVPHRPHLLLGALATALAFLAAAGFVVGTVPALHPSTAATAGDQPVPARPGVFGLLPTPPPVPSTPPAAVEGVQPVAYDGPAQLTLAGPLPDARPGLRVYRYAPPGPPAGAVFDPGALPPVEDAATYPARSPREAGRAAVATAPVSQVGPSPAPVVALIGARLVYVAVPDGVGGYLEPAYLFSGAFRSGGVSYEKRILVPALTPSMYR